MTSITSTQGLDTWLQKELENLALTRLEDVQLTTLKVQRPQESEQTLYDGLGRSKGLQRRPRSRTTSVGTSIKDKENDEYVLNMSYEDVR